MKCLRLYLHAALEQTVLELSKSTCLAKTIYSCRERLKISCIQIYDEPLMAYQICNMTKRQH